MVHCGVGRVAYPLKKGALDQPSTHSAAEGLTVQIPLHPHPLEASLGQTPNPKWLLMGLTAYGMAADTHDCVNVCVNR